MRRLSSNGSQDDVLRDSTRTSPASGTSSLLINLRMVLLPAPLRPTSATVSPVRMSNVNPRSTATGPRARWTPSNRIATGGKAATAGTVSPADRGDTARALPVNRAEVNQHG